nr:alpha/beta hydrolase [Hyphomonas sp. Mor2]
MTTFSAGAQDVGGMKFVPPQQDEGAIELYDGAAPGSENATQTETWFDAGTERWITNVTVPTLLPVLPDDPNETRAAVIVVPGGGFQFVSIDNEGYPIADWLAERGIAAFVLKYRVMPSPEDAEGFAAHMGRLFAPQPGEERIDVGEGIPFAVADAQTALNLVRAKADEWGYDADKIGMVGFSAGAMTTLGVSTVDDEAAPKPDFIGYIYGPMVATDLPDQVPPMFNAIAADDPLFKGQGFGLVEAWQATGADVELHYYQNGGHGFGSYKRGATADRWFDQFMAWMDTRGLLAKAETENAD